LDTPTPARDALVVALDMNGKEALALARSIQGTVKWLKVGMTLFYECGPSIVERLRGLGFEVFLDLKLHDIPHQVEGAARTVGALGAGMLTVHASGGSAMMAAAVRGAQYGASQAGVAPPAVLAVTVLTSIDDNALAAVGVARTAAEQVTLLARVASAAGVDGVVCSVAEAAEMREMLGPRALVVTPGIRPELSVKGDQARVDTAAAALARGASHIVVGRPITTAAVPADAVVRILSEMSEVTR
jgi:orotidine-5'-phosphate decarboxylase